MRRPLIYPLTVLIAGILIGDDITFHYLWLAFAFVFILVALIFFLRKKRHDVAFALILFFIFFAGFFNISQYQNLRNDEDHIMHFASRGKMTIEGVVISEEQTSPQQSLMLVECVRLLSDQVYFKLSGKIRITIPSLPSFNRGDYIRFRTFVKPVSGFLNPGGFDYRRYLNRQGIFVSGYISGAGDIILIRRGWQNSAPAFIDRFRQYLKRLIYANAQTPEREIIEALTIGNQKSIPRNIQDAFAETGTSHILSISGLHVGLVSSGGFFLMFGLLKLSEYLMLRFNIFKFAAAFSLIPVAIYTLVAGMGTPVLRSAFMALSFLVALMIGKSRDLFNVLFGAAFVILAIIPESLFEISFQLSFSAVFSLIYIVPRLEHPPFSFPQNAPQWFQASFRRFYLFIVVSIAATIGTLPIMIYYFNRISTVTLIANLLVVPLLGILALLCVLLFILSAIFSATVAGWLIHAASLFTSLSVDIIKGLASLPASSLTVVKPGWFEIILYYVALLGLIELSTRSENHKQQLFISHRPLLWKTLTIASCALFVFNVAYDYWKDKTSTDLTLTAIDVGQGSSTLIEFPGGTRMLVDGGGFPDSAFDIGRSVIAPFLYYKKIKNIDIVVLTHPHPDHLHGLIYILKNFNVREVWTTTVEVDDDLYRLWKKTLAEKGIRICYKGAETPAELLAGAKIDFLWPDQLPSNKHALDINDQSLVFKITFGNKRFLITGDISSRVETLLIASGRSLRSDLLLVPHHGSVHSSCEKFIQKVSPRYAIASAGKNNVFRHPHPEIINRYITNGASIYRTDRQGAILVHSDGENIVVSPWLN